MSDSNWIQFEDDYFETKEGKRPQDNRIYKPIVCHHKWFFNEKVFETAESLQNQANYCYWIKDYAQASSFYEKVLNEYFSNSPFMKRNLLESVARCQFQLGDLTKTKELAEECLTLSYTVELKSSILDLLTSVYGSLGLWSMQKEAYLELISYHPHNYRMWWDLSICVSTLSKSSEESLVHIMMEAACLIRVSMIMMTMKDQEKAPLLQKAEDKLCSMSLPENFISTGKKFYSRDLSEDYLDAEEPKDLGKSNCLEDVLSSEPTNHEILWFKWIYSFLK